MCKNIICRHVQALPFKCWNCSIRPTVRPEIEGNPSRSVEFNRLFHDNVVKFHQISWNFIKFHDISPNFMKSHTPNFTKCHEIWLNSVKFHEIWWNVMKFDDMSQNLMKCHENCGTVKAFHSIRPTLRPEIEGNPFRRVQFRRLYQNCNFRKQDTKKCVRLLFVGTVKAFHLDV